MLPSWMTVVLALRTLLTWVAGGMEQSFVCFCHGLRFCCAYCCCCCLKKKDAFFAFDDRVSCFLGVLCTYFYLLVKIFGGEGLLYGFIVVTLLENNMALVESINYYL